MEYELNVKMEKGKVKAKATMDMEFFGFRVRIKDYEIDGDFNDLIKKLTEIIESNEKQGALIVIGNLAKMLGVKKEAIDKLKTAFIAKM